MRKISTLFQKDPQDLGRVIPEIHPDNIWVLEGDFIATQKFDGTAAAIINTLLYKRYDVKKGRSIPEEAIACQAADKISWHHPHWVPCKRENPEDKYFWEAFDRLEVKQEGTYELCGPKVQGNPEKLEQHTLIKHGSVILTLPEIEFFTLREYLKNPENDIEGIVFHHTNNGSQCKLRKKDFGFKR